MLRHQCNTRGAISDTQQKSTGTCSEADWSWRRRWTIVQKGQASRVGTSTEHATQYETVGRIGGQCHISAIKRHRDLQLEPPYFSRGLRSLPRSDTPCLLDTRESMVPTVLQNQGPPFATKFKLYKDRVSTFLLLGWSI